LTSNSKAITLPTANRLYNLYIVALLTSSLCILIKRQLLVGEDVAEQVARGDHRIMGVMIESHLHAGLVLAPIAPQAIKSDTY
jgi:phospho-2-dehydro-3-deoxyheptonate aldolase